MNGACFIAKTVADFFLLLLDITRLHIVLQ